MKKNEALIYGIGFNGELKSLHTYNNVLKKFKKVLNKDNTNLMLNWHSDTSDSANVYGAGMNSFEKSLTPNEETKK